MYSVWHYLYAQYILLLTVWVVRKRQILLAVRDICERDGNSKITT